MILPSFSSPVSFILHKTILLLKPSDIRLCPYSKVDLTSASGLQAGKFPSAHVTCIPASGTLFRVLPHPTWSALSFIIVTTVLPVKAQFSLRIWHLLRTASDLKSLVLRITRFSFCILWYLHIYIFCFPARLEDCVNRICFHIFLFPLSPAIPHPTLPLFWCIIAL